MLSNYFKEKETQLQKELGTHEAKRAMTEENVNESVKRILETEENLTRYKSQVRCILSSLFFFKSNFFPSPSKLTMKNCAYFCRIGGIADKGN